MATFNYDINFVLPVSMSVSEVSLMLYDIVPYSISSKLGIK